MERIIPITDLQTRAKKYVDQVREAGEPLVITRRGRAAAVLMDYDQYEGLRETGDELSYPDWRTRLARARKEFSKGKFVTLDAYRRRRSGTPPSTPSGAR